MGRGAAEAPEPVRGAHARAYMRRDPDYRAAWAAQAGRPAPLRGGVSAQGALLAGAGATVEGLSLEEPCPRRMHDNADVKRLS